MRRGPPTTSNALIPKNSHQLSFRRDACSSVVQSMPAVALRTSPVIDDALVPSLNSWDNRRSSVRRTLSELSWLNQIRVKYGPTVSLLDLSAGGAQIETTSYRLKPGTAVVVEIAAGSETFLVPSRVLRAHVSRIMPSATTYRAALAFKDSLDLARLPEAGRHSDRNLNLVLEHSKLNVALRRLDESMLLHGGSATGVGRSAVAAALAIMESPSGRRAGAAFSREMSRLFRIITMGLSHGTAPRTILDQMVEGVRRAVPAQVISVVNQGSLVGVSSDAICFDGLSPDTGSAARLVVEFPRGCRLDSWHLSFLKAAAHLATVITEIDQMVGARDRAATTEASRELPVGWKRLVLRFLDGRLLKGFNTDFAAAKGLVHIWMVPNGPEASRITVPLEHLKALFFVHDLEGDPTHRPNGDAWTEHGRRIEVTFVDGEVLAGTTLSYSQKGPGFFVTPLDASGNNLSLFVVSGAVRQVKFP